MSRWDIDTYTNIKQALSLGKSVKLIMEQNLNSFGKQSYKITKVRTCKNRNELEVEIENRGTYIPIGDQDLVIIE